MSSSIACATTGSAKLTIHQQLSVSSPRNSPIYSQRDVDNLTLLQNLGLEADILNLFCNLVVCPFRERFRAERWRILGVDVRWIILYHAALS